MSSRTEGQGQPGSVSFPVKLLYSPKLMHCDVDFSELLGKKIIAVKWALL